MAWFVFEANIAHYKKRLAHETDPKTIAMLRKLLAEEEAKLVDYNTKNPKPRRRLSKVASVGGVFIRLPEA
jgi:hypothetical protein